MKTIEKQLQTIKAQKRIGLMTHVVAGYPTLAATTRLIQMMERAGVDFIEIQMPFSDPIADGSTIMQANDVALANGVTVDDCFELVSSLSKKAAIPLLLMGYYNSVFHYGVERFCKKAAASGVAGLIIPDFPIDEESNEGFIALCEKYGLARIPVLSPTSTVERLQLNATYPTPFIYCTTYAGTTGSKGKVGSQLSTYLKTVRTYLKKPLAVGFGISKQEHVRMLCGSADIAVVGSALISQFELKGVAGVKTLLYSLIRAR